MFAVFFFKQKTAYEMRISDWSSDVCSSDLDVVVVHLLHHQRDPGEILVRQFTRRLGGVGGGGGQQQRQRGRRKQPPCPAHHRRALQRHAGHPASSTRRVMPSAPVLRPCAPAGSTGPATSQ